MDDLRLLAHLAKKQGITSTKLLAKELKASQQTLSRRLIALERRHLISRQVTNRGMTITILAQGYALLRDMHLILSSVFAPAAPIKGKVQSGIGEGQFYIRKYAAQLKELLGFEPWPGTLNLKVALSDAAKVKAHQPLVIKEFTTKERTYGEVHCYPASISNITGAILMPVRSTHPEDILEFIAPVELRNKFQLKDNDTLTLSLAASW